MFNVVLHATNIIPWQARWISFFTSGFKRHGINIRISQSNNKADICDLAILFGPNRWKNVENSGVPYIMVNRKFFGKEDHVAGDIVALSWNGFNGEGFHCVDEIDPNRLEKFISLDEIKPWKKDGSGFLLCGQADLGRCTTFPTTYAWYDSIVPPHTFRPHPTQSRYPLPSLVEDLQDVQAVITLNSTVAVEVLMEGIPIISMDHGNPLYGVTGHSIGDIRYPDRMPILNHLAHCQWHYTEITDGSFWEQLHTKCGKRLCEFSS